MKIWERRWTKTRFRPSEGGKFMPEVRPSDDVIEKAGAAECMHGSPLSSSPPATMTLSRPVEVPEWRRLADEAGAEILRGEDWHRVDLGEDCSVVWDDWSAERAAVEVQGLIERHKADLAKEKTEDWRQMLRDDGWTPLFQSTAVEEWQKGDIVWGFSLDHDCTEHARNAIADAKAAAPKKTRTPREIAEAWWAEWAEMAPERRRCGHWDGDWACFPKRKQNYAHQTYWAGRRLPNDGELGARAYVDGEHYVFSDLQKWERVTDVENIHRHRPVVQGVFYDEGARKYRRVKQGGGAYYDVVVLDIPVFLDEVTT